MNCGKISHIEVRKLADYEKDGSTYRGKTNVYQQIHATTVASGDLRVRSFNSPLLLWIPMRLVLGLSKPRKPVLGVELSGEIEEIGKGVKQFKGWKSYLQGTGTHHRGPSDHSIER
jgi:NADPH:quinone reductase-like Zn-dependent oxidoreductase